MAAILCQSVSSLCSTACSGCGHICKLPCTLCTSVCKPMCEGIRKVCSSPFCIYVTVALGLNIPQIMFGLTTLPYAACKGSQWLSVNALFCIAHITAACYLAMQSKSFNETMQTLCYDPWIAVYILVGIVSMIWLWTGTGWARNGVMGNGNNCPDDIGNLTWNAVYCGHAFFFFGVSALGLSLLVSMCRNGNGNGSSSIQGGSSDQKSGAKYFAFPDRDATAKV